MSVQYGRWSFDRAPFPPEHIQRVTNLLLPYGGESGNAYSDRDLSIISCSSRTAEEVDYVTQPCVSRSGFVLTWDGRLDNGTELARDLEGFRENRPADVPVVAAAYERWGLNCFPKLVGDWALSIWHPQDRVLILAKDPLGIRQLYFHREDRRISWSTVLDPLTALADRPFALNEEYLAGWFSHFPAVHLTPYSGIYGVSPSCYVLLRPQGQTIHKYWDFDPEKQTRYSKDRDYEEHFRTVFTESVRRRVRSTRPVLAELSGGMDSTAIVCVADAVLARGAAETPRLDTVSYYSDSEPNWNERPYFTKVEALRGRSGCHIDVGSHETLAADFPTADFCATPAYAKTSAVARELGQLMKSQGNRVLLSGIGGDEVTGGVPNPAPELEDLLARGKFRLLAHQLFMWSMDKRKPWFYLLFDAVRSFLPARLFSTPAHKRPAPWLRSGFVKKNQPALLGYEKRITLSGGLPSFQENMLTLEALRRQISCEPQPSDPAIERRYPYLDRDLLEFLYAVPRSQIVRPGERRSLMRRALKGIVPAEILNRRRKAYVVRGTRENILSLTARLIPSEMLCATLGLLKPDSLSTVIRELTEGQEVPFVALLRTLAVETWLQSNRHLRTTEAARAEAGPCQQAES